jgi:leucyl-tRNA synthetase
LWSFSHKHAWTKENSVHVQEWPAFDEDLTKDTEIVIPIQINGKVRSEVSIQRGQDEASVREAVISNERIISLLRGMTSKSSFMFLIRS